MKRILIGILLTLIIPVVAQETRRGRPVHTYSIVARDSVTGEMGVAVQSHWFSVGSLVPWAEAGVGAVATQSFVDPAYGPLGLELMRAGKSAQQALDALVASDAGRDVRQVSMINASGSVAAHTGARCIQAAGHIIGRNYSVQANLMRNDEVPAAMSKAFESTHGSLAERMMSALDAAEAVGGDIRGKQSAAILIVKAESTGRPWMDRTVDLRVEDHPEPLIELRRLLTVHRAYVHMNNGDLAIEAGDMERAKREYAAAEALFPDNLEMKFWHAVALVNAGKLDEALSLFRITFKGDESWRELVPRLPQAGVLPSDEKIIRRITGIR